ncbi:hypothetical protein MEZE111188_04505 [Mesobacillus zeae]
MCKIFFLIFFVSLILGILSVPRWIFALSKLPLFLFLLLKGTTLLISRNEDDKVP